MRIVTLGCSVSLRLKLSFRDCGPSSRACKKNTLHCSRALKSRRLLCSRPEQGCPQLHLRSMHFRHRFVLDPMSFSLDPWWHTHLPSHMLSQPVTREPCLPLHHSKDAFEIAIKLQSISVEAAVIGNIINSIGGGHRWLAVALVRNRSQQLLKFTSKHKDLCSECTQAKHSPFFLTGALKGCCWRLSKDFDCRWSEI